MFAAAILGIDLPVGAQIALGAVLLVQLGLQIAALVDLVRQPAANVRPSKIVWVIVILFGNLLGAVLYFVVGRPFAATVPDQPPAPEAAADRAQAAADLLYGRDRRP